MAGGIYHQTAPGEARFVLNRDRRCGKPGGGDIHQLKKGLETVHRAERRWRGELRASGGDFPDVALVLAPVLNFLARVVGLNHERCFCRLVRLEGGRKSRLAREVLRESLAATLPPPLRIAPD